MTEDKMFVDNPLLLTGLFGEGMFLIPERKKLKFAYSGQGNEGILNIVFYENKKVPRASLETIHKLMMAVKMDGKSLKPGDFAWINAADVADEDPFQAILDDFKPRKVIVWTDTWFSPSKDIVFYRMESVSSTDLLRCHSPHTVVETEDLKRECWLAMKQLFGM